jgi:hypothetical protein
MGGPEGWMIWEGRDACLFNSNSAGKPTHLIGDSTACHFGEAAIGASDTLGRPLSIVDVPGCPFGDAFFQSPNMPRERNTEACRQLYESAMHWLVEQPAGTVIISKLNSTYRQPDTAVGLQPHDLTTISTGRAQALDQGITSTIETLKQAGHYVLFVQAAPDFTDPVKFDSLRCTQSELRANSCVGRIPRDVAYSVQRIERASACAIAAQTGSGIWDPGRSSVRMMSAAHIGMA